MERLKHTWYNKIPVAIRRPVVLVVGSLLIIASALTGWLPGPGGIPLFLLGVAVLATEFERARQFRDLILRHIEHFAAWYKRNRALGTVLIIIAAVGAIGIGYLAFTHFR